MPKHWFIKVVRREPLSLDVIKNIANTCQVSITATAYRCVELDVFPSALVFCQSRLIRWFKVSSSFPYKWVPSGQPPDRYSGAGEYFFYGRVSPTPEQTPCTAWFLDDNVSPDQSVMEQCLPMPNLEATLSLIWIP